jgi:hypothetical protein
MNVKMRESGHRREKITGARDSYTLKWSLQGTVSLSRRKQRGNTSIFTVYTFVHSEWYCNSSIASYRQVNFV